MTVGRRAAFTDALGRATTRGRAPRKPAHVRTNICVSTGRPVLLLTRALLLAAFWNPLKQLAVRTLACLTEQPSAGETSS